MGHRSHLCLIKQNLFSYIAYYIIKDQFVLSENAENHLCSFLPVPRSLDLEEYNPTLFLACIQFIGSFI